MTKLQKKIDFIGFITVKRANPNGDPLNGNQPRTDYDGYGEISDVCIKRKIRNRLQEAQEKILVQSDERADDGCDSILSRVKMHPAVGALFANLVKKRILMKKSRSFIKRHAKPGWMSGLLDKYSRSKQGAKKEIARRKTRKKPHYLSACAAL